MNIREKFEQFKQECEKYVGSDLISHVVINTEGTKQEKELFEKLVKIYEYNLMIDMTIEGFTDEEFKFKNETLSIMQHSMYYFKVKGN